MKQKTPKEISDENYCTIQWLITQKLEKKEKAREPKANQR